VIDRAGNFIKEAIELFGPKSFHITNYNSPGATGAPAYSAWIVNRLGSLGHLSHLAPKDGKAEGAWDFERVCAAIDSTA
jgi:L-2-hydroxyglutarate oxidase